jgi:signal peptidase I
MHMNFPIDTQAHSDTASEYPNVDIKKSKPRSNFFLEIVKFALLALLIVVPFRLFVAQPFIVSGASMIPTFDTGEYLIIDQLSYRFKTPERGDVIVFRYPENTSVFFIKRIIGLPGEELRFSNNNITIHNSDFLPDTVLELEEPYLSVENRVIAPSVVSLEEHEYFVLGDNRRASSDSRSWGPLPENLIMGRALIRLLPIQRIDFFPGVHIF